MTQKKFIQLASIAVAFVWMFCITFAVAYKISEKNKTKLPVNQQTVITTGVVYTTTATTTVKTTATTSNPFAASPTLSLPQSTQPIPSEQLTAALSTEQSTTEAPASSVPTEKTEIINAYINGINALKNTQNFSMTKNDTLNVTITDVQMSGGSALKNTVMEYANSLVTPPPPESYTFVEGKDAATGETPNSTIAPLNVAAQVNPDAVTEATATKNADGGYTVNLTLQPETQTMYTPAPNLSTMVEVIDTSALLPDGATMTALDISYAPSSVSAVFDSQGRIVSIEHKLTSTGSGSGKMIINVTMTMEGTYTSKYNITYN